jgi:hypothetical protein
MYNKTIIGFGFRMTSRIIQTSVNVIRLSFAWADNIDLCLNNSWYHAQPQPIIVYYLIASFIASLYITVHPSHFYMHLYGYMSAKNYSYVKLHINTRTLQSRARHITTQIQQSHTYDKRILFLLVRIYDFTIVWIVRLWSTWIF